MAYLLVALRQKNPWRSIRLRKTTEFFKRQNPNDANNTLFAYRYLPDWKGLSVVDEDLYKQMAVGPL